MASKRWCASVAWTWAVFLLLLLVIPGCGPLERMVQDLDRIVMLLDKAISETTAHSTQWQSIVTNVAEQVPKGVDHVIRDEVDLLAHHAIQYAGTEVMCTGDFIIDRTKQHLLRAKAARLAQLGYPVEVPDIIPPHICDPAPHVSEYDWTAGTRNNVLIHGYDLDAKDAHGQLMQFLLYSEPNKEYLPLDPSLVSRSTTYDIVLALGAGKAGFERLLRLKQITKICYVWNGRILETNEIKLNPVVYPPPKKEKVTLGKLPYTPPHVPNRGDKEGDGNLDVTVIGETKLEVDGSKISARAYMVAQEYNDKSRAEGWSEWTTAYTAPAGWKIVRATPLGQAKYVHSYRKVNTDLVPMLDAQAVHSFMLFLDKEGDELGSFTRVEVEFNPVVVELEMIPIFGR
jgi:hypothetical protein